MVVVVEPLCALHETGDAREGAHPDVPVCVLLQSQYVAIVQPLTLAIETETCQFLRITDIRQSLVSGEPHTTRGCSDSMVDLARRQSFADTQMAVSTVVQVESVDAVAQSGYKQLVRSRLDDAGGRCMNGLADEVVQRGLPVLIQVDAKLPAYPDVAVGVLGKGVDVGALGTERNERELLAVPVEAVSTLVVDSYPHAPLTVGHQTSWEGIPAPDGVQAAPPTLDAAIVPPHQLILAGHPESLLWVGGDGTDRRPTVAQVFIV